MKFRKPYDPPKRVPTVISSNSRTQQHFKKECDINFIMAKYQKTGLLEHVNTYQGDYADLADAPDYLSAMQKINEANHAFSTLPSSLRKRFENNPHNFLNFVMDENNYEECVEMGLMVPKPTPSSPTDVPPVADTEPPAPVE